MARTIQEVEEVRSWLNLEALRRGRTLSQGDIGGAALRASDEDFTVMLTAARGGS